MSIRSQQSLQDKALQGNRLNLIAFFGGLCLFLSTIEYLIPKPIPFFRLGLANLPLLLAFPLLRGREIVWLTTLKVLGQALVNGTLASYVFLFSFSGSVSSVLVMYAAWRLFGKHVSVIGISLLGALASNSVQIGLSLEFIFGQNAWVIAPIFMAMGISSGLAIGFICVIIQRKSKWYKELIDGIPYLELPRIKLPSGGVEPAEIPVNHAETPGRTRKYLVKSDFLVRFLTPNSLFLAGLVLLPALFFRTAWWCAVGRHWLF